MENHSFISVAQLRKTYIMGNQKVHALAGVDLEIQAGSFTVIMGPSGSGKSTLLYLLGGLDRSTSGSIIFEGSFLEKMDENTLALYRRNKVGFIFQSFNLIQTMTALENVEFPMRFSGVSAAERRKRAIRLLNEVGLSKRALHRPTELSGGQQQRVAIARALVNNPPLILADEPTGNLDTGSGLSIVQTLSALHESGRTVVVVTHDVRMTQFASNVIYLLDGMIVSEAEYLEASKYQLSESGREE
jgi:putative ABC transport system ATP-binding protein